MKQDRIGLVAFLILALSLTGCTKKTMEEASLPGNGVDTASTSEELSQIPSATPSTPVEPLPIETSPVTQAPELAPAPAAAVALPTKSSVSSSGLSHEKQIQTALKNAGLYQGNVDGKLGPASKKAIETFQTNNGLKADGKVGPKTWAALQPYLNGTATSSQTSTEQ